MTPHLPLVITRHFLATPLPCARNSRQNWFRDKTAYVVLLTIVEGPLQPGTASSITLSVTIFFFWHYQRYFKRRFNNRWLKFLIGGWGEVSLSSSPLHNHVIICRSYFTPSPIIADGRLLQEIYVGGLGFCLTWLSSFSKFSFDCFANINWLEAKQIQNTPPGNQEGE